ncbi:MAG: AraC family transcriptional regulator [Brevundimonas sp.]
MTAEPAPVPDAPPRGALTLVPPPPDLAPALVGFVRRIDPGCGGVVRLLPEIRSSLQVHAADPYRVREQAPEAEWRQVPRVSLWGPRHAWGWGWARRDVSAFAVGLTPAGLAALTGAPAPGLVNQVRPAAAVHPTLAALDAGADEPFEGWIARAADILRAVFAARPVLPDPLVASLPILATGDGDAAARAAAVCGLSQRQHRRLFHRLHGASPKAYQRLLRVDRMIRSLHDAPWEADAWAGAPIPYADQPHAIREFRALTGLTPRAYVRAKRSGDATLRSVSGDPSAPPAP